MYTMEYYSVIKKNEILPSATIWRDLEGIVLRGKNQRKINAIWFYLYVESKEQNKWTNNTEANSYREYLTVVWWGVRGWVKKGRGLRNANW